MNDLELLTNEIEILYRRMVERKNEIERESREHPSSEFLDGMATAYKVVTQDILYILELIEAEV